MLDMILDPIRDWKLRNWLTSVAAFAEKVKKANTYFFLADENQKEALNLAKMILKHCEKAKQGNKASKAIVIVCLEGLEELGKKGKLDKKGKELLAKMPS